jgi:hypothetical protein
MEDLSHPHKSHTVLGALIFTHGDIVDEIPYDERISFMGEELCFAIRAYTRGWYIYAPNEMLVWHYYKRDERPKIWNDNIPGGRSWTELEMASQRVQENILLGKEQGIFGIGDYDKYLEYQEMIGINFNKFYNKEIHERTNLGLITTETVFDDEFNLIEVSMSGYCTENLHSQCFAKDNCDCVCHEVITIK